MKFGEIWNIVDINMQILVFIPDYYTFWELDKPAICETTCQNIDGEFDAFLKLVQVQYIFINFWYEFAPPPPPQTVFLSLSLSFSVLKLRSTSETLLQIRTRWWKVSRECCARQTMFMSDRCVWEHRNEPVKKKKKIVNEKRGMKKTELSQKRSWLSPSEWVYWARYYEYIYLQKRKILLHLICIWKQMYSAPLNMIKGT